MKIEQEATAPVNRFQQSTRHYDNNRGKGLILFLFSSLQASPHRWHPLVGAGIPEIMSRDGSGVCGSGDDFLGWSFTSYFPSETSVNDCLQMIRSNPHWPWGWRDPRPGQNPTTDSYNNPICLVSFWIEIHLLLTDFKMRSVVLLTFYDFTSLISP